MHDANQTGNAREIEVTLMEVCQAILETLCKDLLNHCGFSILTKSDRILPQHVGQVTSATLCSFNLK